MADDEKGKQTLYGPDSRPIPEKPRRERRRLKDAPKVFWEELPLFPKRLVVSVGFLVVAFGIWSVLGQPGKPWLGKQWYFLTHPIPTGDPARFTVAIAELEGDHDCRIQQQIIDGLVDLEGFKGLDLIAIPRSIPSRGPHPQAQIASGHETARRYLIKSRSDVLIWGRAILPKQARLFWTTAEAGRRGWYTTDERSPLPSLFIDDLKVVLQTLLLTKYADLQQEGHFVADRLTPFTDRMQEFLASHPTFQPDTLAALQLVHADAFATIGEQAGDSTKLVEAAKIYRAIAQTWTRERVPLDWAATQNNLGTALTRLGERESGTARLEEAVATYKEALKERTRERVPLDWAATQNNLGTALTRLGERESGTARLEEAIAAYREALKERTRKRVPLDWAATQNNLAVALSTLGEREQGTVSLKEAVATYREALKERTRERVPLDWAMTQNNLGAVLWTLGEREQGTARLEEAVAAYREALKEWTRERVPLNWAAIQNNLAVALSTLGEREPGTARLEEAVAACRKALKVRTRRAVPLDWAMTQNNLGNALSTLGDRESGTARLEEAVAACRKALKEWTRERVPLQWATAQDNLGNALRVLGERTGDPSQLQQALVAHLGAWEVFEPVSGRYAARAARGIRSDLRAAEELGRRDALTDSLGESMRQSLRRFLVSGPP